jgi:hypothetical protein
MVWLFTSRFGIVGAALAWLPTAIFVQILCIYFIRDNFHGTLKNVAKPMLAIFVSTIAGAGVSALVISMFDTIPGLVLSGVLAVLVTGATLWISDQRYSLGLARNIAIAFPQLAAFLKIQSVEIN